MSNDPNDRFMISDLSSKLSAYINGEYSDQTSQTRDPAEIGDVFASEIKPEESGRKLPGDELFTDLDQALVSRADDGEETVRRQKLAEEQRQRAEEARRQQFREEQQRQQRLREEQQRQLNIQEEQQRQLRIQEEQRQQRLRREKAIVRFNRIYNVGGPDEACYQGAEHGDTRKNIGIYADDGTYNAAIYGNIIQGTEKYYDIDCRAETLDADKTRPEGCQRTITILDRQESERIGRETRRSRSRR